MTELEQTREAYLGGTDPAMAPASPLADVPGGLPPLLIACGDSEMFLDDATRFAEAAADQGADVELDIFQGMPHGFPLLALEAAGTLMNRVAEFTTSRLTGMSGAAARELSVRRIGWAGYEIVTERGTRLVIDPYLRGSEGIHSGIPASPVPVADLAGADVIAVTHAGYDHRGQALQIAQAGHAVLVCGSALFAAAMKAGFPPDRLAVMVSGVEFQYRDITLKSLPARHESTMTIDGAFVADQPQSFLLTTADGARVFCGGDTSLSEDLRTWGEIYHPSIAILGIGGLWLGPVKIIELPPSEAAVAVRWLGVSTVIPVHHHPSDPAPAQLAAELAGSGIEVAALDFGAIWTAPRRWPAPSRAGSEAPQIGGEQATAGSVPGGVGGTWLGQHRAKDDDVA
jgi:L-ascorbate metabolism protein UlaG (beta-lactamase superfamily)